MSVFGCLWRALLVLSLVLSGQSYAQMGMPAPEVAPAQTASHCEEANASADATMSSHAHEASTAATHAPGSSHDPDCCKTSSCHCAGSHCATCVIGFSEAGLAVKRHDVALYSPTRYGSPLLEPSLRPPIA